MTTPLLLGAIIGGAFGGSFFLFCLWLNAKDAQRRYPELRIPVPANAQNDPLFHIWCDASHYQQQPDGSYQSTRRGILADSGEIHFEHNEMLVYEVIDIVVPDELVPQQEINMTVRRADGSSFEVSLLSRIDTAIEGDYYLHGGILPFVLRELMAA